MNGQLLAGTTKGVFAIDDAGSTQTLEARHVRDLVNVDGRLFAGAAAGLFTSTDGGQTWAGPQLAGREVWQVSDDAQWTELGSGLPLVWSLAVV